METLSTKGLALPLILLGLILIVVGILIYLHKRNRKNKDPEEDDDITLTIRYQSRDKIEPPSSPSCPGCEKRPNIEIVVVEAPRRRHSVASFDYNTLPPRYETVSGNFVKN